MTASTSLPSHSSEISPPTGLKKANFKVEGMDCAHCVRSVEGAIAKMPGIGEYQLSFTTEKLSVSYDPTRVQVADFAKAIEPLGYKVHHVVSIPVRKPAQKIKTRPTYQPPAAVVPEKWWRTRAVRPVVLLLGLFVAARIFATLVPAYAQWGFAIAALVGGWRYARAAYHGAKAGNFFNIKTQVAIAAVGSVVIGKAPEATLVLLLFSIGEMLEGIAAGRAREGIRSLLQLAPKTAFLLEDNTEYEINVDALEVGDLVRVRPGGRVPGDGVIVSGASSLDESPITGESLPIFKKPGDTVYAGSINGDAVLNVRLECPTADNTISRIIKMVEDAETHKAPTARIIDRFTRVYTPAVMIFSLLVMVVPPLLMAADWKEWIYKGLALMLIGCPCAVLLSVPAAITSGLTTAARRGVLIKGGAALETLGKVKTVAFDKTGTLTAGQPKVTQIVALEGSDSDVLRLAAAVESGSSHPLAHAILERAKQDALEIPRVSDALAIPGKAVTATLEGRKLSVGSPRYALEVATLSGTVQEQIAALEQQGQTVVVLLEGNRALGVIAIRDEPRSDAKHALAQLKEMQIQTVMLTGDNARTGNAIGKVLGLEVAAELMPQDKLERIEQLQKVGLVAMVGDGINDAPALALADVGIAMGGGTDVALETADAALLKNQVVGVVEAIQLSKATLKIVLQNIVLTASFKIFILITNLSGITGLTAAVVADMGTMLVATLNALRMLRWKP
jgi:Zn2+/Cd2+-exporting ATPase